MELKAWLDRVFGEADPSKDYNLARLEGICEPDEHTALLLTEVFENPTALLGRYQEAVVDRALWDLGCEAFGAVLDDSIEWKLRARLIGSFETLFREWFAPRCAPVLSHLSEDGRPLNGACYMWWDFDCWRPFAPRDTNPCDDAFLTSMQTILSIDNVACKESALHGLGHWHGYNTSAIEAIIDGFLQHSPDIREELREYALNARRGRVQ